MKRRKKEKQTIEDGKKEAKEKGGKDPEALVHSAETDTAEAETGADTYELIRPETGVPVSVDHAASTVNDSSAGAAREETEPQFSGSENSLTAAAAMTGEAAGQEAATMAEAVPEPDRDQDKNPEPDRNQDQDIFRLPRKRIRFFLTCVVLLMIGLTGKLALVQLVDQDRYAEVAARQQQIVLEGIDKRGTIYDRNGKPLTGSKEEYVYLIRKDEMNADVKRLLGAIDARRLSSANDRYDLYCSAKYHAEETEELQKEHNAFVIRAPQRYSEDQLAVHVIGYVSGMDGEGVCGLEKDFDSWLSQRDKVVYAVADGANYIIPGLGIRNSTDKDCGLVTTLDSDIQKEAEELLREKKVTGTIVVAEAKTGEILACASEPSYSPNEVKDYLNSSSNELLNLASQGLYAPGSVFKVVIAAAALENGAADENTTFTCKGYEEINGIRIKCSTGGKNGHGTITLRQAFEKSCNCSFIQLGEKVGAEAILKEAETLGLGDKTLTGISGEKSGNIPLMTDVQGAGIGNLSIGQGKLLVTPLEICKMTQIVANGGRSADLKLVRGIVENGRLEQFSGKDEKQLMTPETAALLRSFMVDTVKTGTANNIKDVSAGGKTGSAEAAENGEDVVHGWFTGFAPAENPKYVITVFVDKGGSGRTSAVPLFGEIVRSLEQKDKR